MQFHGPTLPHTAEGDFQKGRELLLRSLLGVSLGACLVVVWWEVLPASRSLAFSVVIGLGIVLVSVLLIMTGWSFRVRATALLLGMFACAATAMVLEGFMPNLSLAFALIVISSQLLLGSRAAFVALGVTALWICVTGWLHQRGTVTSATDMVVTLNPREWGNTFRIASIYFVLTAASVVGISYILKRAHHLSRQSLEAFAVLAAEQAETERLLGELSARESAYRKAAELAALGRLAGSVAHDFNNSLAVLLAVFDEIEQKRKKPQELDDTLWAGRQAIQQAIATTRQLRLLSPKARRRPSVVVDLGEALMRCCRLLERILPRNVSLSLEVVEDGRVEIEEAELQRSLVNLALNGCDAMREGGELRLILRRTASGEHPHRHLFAIDMVDKGSGMSSDTLEHLFQPYFTTKELSGTGLGLWGVRDWALKAGGDVRVQSQPGKGTTVTIVWPAFDGKTDLAEPPASGAKRTPFVLLLDRDTDARERDAVALGECRMMVHALSSLSEALLFLRRERSQLDVLCIAPSVVEEGGILQRVVGTFRQLHGAGHVLLYGSRSQLSGMRLDYSDSVLCTDSNDEALPDRVLTLMMTPEPALHGLFRFGISASSEDDRDSGATPSRGTDSAQSSTGE